MALRRSRPDRTVEHARRAVLFVDVVESVRLMEEDEDGAVSRWVAFVDQVESEILPKFGGHLVKRMGDGILLEFADAREATVAAFAIQHANSRASHRLPPERRQLLRMGMEAGDVIVERDDIYGRGVNIANRLTALAGPSEIVVSANARSQLTPILDADVEDLGECFLRHIREPVRAFRIGPPGPQPVIGPATWAGELRPTLAIVPFEMRGHRAEHHAFGEVLAEELIRSLSRSAELNVISRLSTTAFRGRDLSVEQISAHLKANYVLSGTYHVDGRTLVAEAELAEAKSGHIVWVERLEDDLAGMLDGQRTLVDRMTAGIGAAVVSRELERARSQPPPTLKTYTLMLGAVALMHRLSLRDFEDAHHLLRTVLDRASRQATPCAWMAKWHVLRVQQGWSPDPDQDARIALQYTNQALDADPDSALALAIDGFVHTNLLKRLDIAEQRYDRAIAVNPSEPLAWLLRGTLRAFRGEGDAAVADAQRALALSPLDPHRYFYDSLAASAFISARRYDDALEAALRSYRANRTHTSTLRVMAVARWRLGRHAEARATAEELLRLEPALTVSRWLARSPSAAFEVGKDFADVLRDVGVPA